MLPYQLNLLRHFRSGEKTLAGEVIDWADYHYATMLDVDRLRSELDSPCVLIRGSHGLDKETAVDCVFPHKPFADVVMALFRVGCSKGLYEGGSIHLDHRMGPLGLARCWLAFKPSSYPDLVSRGFGPLKAYSNDGWDYYRWGHPQSFALLNVLLERNA